MSKVLLDAWFAVCKFNAKDNSRSPAKQSDVYAKPAGMKGVLLYEEVIRRKPSVQHNG